MPLKENLPREASGDQIADVKHEQLTEKQQLEQLEALGNRIKKRIRFFIFF